MHLLVTHFLIDVLESQACVFEKGTALGYAGIDRVFQPGRERVFVHGTGIQLHRAEHEHALLFS